MNYSWALDTSQREYQAVTAAFSVPCASPRAVLLTSWEKGLFPMNAHEIRDYTKYTSQGNQQACHQNNLAVPYFTLKKFLHLTYGYLNVTSYFQCINSSWDD